MALYSKRQFADLAGVPTNNLSNYIKRGHVVLHGGKPCKCPKNKCTCLIDSGDPKNALFLERNGVEEKAAPVPAKKPETTQKRPETTATAGSQKKARLIELQEQKMERQNQVLEHQNRLLEAKIQKTYEEVIPRDFASFAVRNYAAGIANVWLTATERFLMQKGTALGLTREEIIQHKKYIKEILNDSIKKGADEADRNARKVAREYAGRKERGERDD